MSRVTTSRLLALLVGLGVVATAVAVMVVANQPRSPAQRAAEANALRAGIRVTPTVESVSLVATKALADYGIGQHVGLVRVRIVEQMRLRLEVSSERDMDFAEKPKVCLVGPDSAPDDAGLEDRCWGDPELGRLLFGAAGGPDVPNLGPAAVLLSTVTLSRGNVRCDYAPGDWVFQLKVNPLVDGLPAGAEYITHVPFTVPIPAHGPLPLLRIDTTRYCGLATRIVREQGEPEVIEP